MAVMKTLATSWSLWRHARFAIANTICSLICYYVGYSLSSPQDFTPLSRAGAAATALAIGFMLYDYRHALNTSEQRANATFAKATSKLQITGEASQRKLEEKTKRNTESAVARIALWEASILIIATLVWGFGDLAKHL